MLPLMLSRFSYHIGESMLPSINHFYEYIGADEKLRSFGFAKKVGAAARFKQNKREACMYSSLLISSTILTFLRH